MPIKLPQYQGTYERAFLPPVLILSLGRFGAQVCQAFFEELEAAFAVDPAENHSDRGRLSLKDLIASMALVRKMDEGELPLGWASSVHFWDGRFDQDEGDRFRIEATYRDAAFWAPPASLFRAAASETLGTMAATCAQLLESVSNDVWRARRESLGLPRITDFEYVPRLIIAVGSLCEPDVAGVVPFLRHWTAEKVVHGEASWENIALLDCGLPDHPDVPHQTWQQCPASLVAQLLSSVRAIKPTDPYISFFTTHCTLGGIDVPVIVRSQVMAGILKTYLLSTLCRRSAAAPGYRGNLLKPGIMSHRAAAYVEVILNVDNLPNLVVKAVLSEWKSRLKALVSVLTLDQLHEGLSVLMGGDPDELKKLLTLSCARATVDAGSTWAVEQFRGFVEEKRKQVLEEIGRLADRRPVPPSQPMGDNLWHRLLKWLTNVLGGPNSSGQQSRDSATAPPRYSSRAALEKVEGQYTRVLQYLAQLLPFLGELIRPQSDFAQRADGDDFEQDVLANRVVLKYRRLPLDGCPPDVRQFVDSNVTAVDSILLNLLLKGNPVIPLLSLVKTQLEARFRPGAATSAEAESARRSEGIMAWINADAGLRNFVADFASYRLAPLWRLSPQKNTNWSGFLSVLEYGGRSPNDSAEVPTRQAVERLLADMRTALSVSDPLKTLQSKWRIGESLDKKDVHLESWPFYRSIGFLWTEYPTSGRGFGDDFDASQLKAREDKWRTESPDEAAWLPLAAAATAAE